MTLTPFPNQPAIDEEAARWVARADAGPLTPTEKEELEAWLARSPQHRRRFGELAAVQQTLHAGLDRQAELAGGQLSVTGAAQLLVRRRPVFASGIAASLVGIVASGLLLLAPFLPSGPEIVRTAVGEQLERELADGTSMTLNTATDLEVSLAKRERRVVMDHGEVLFDVAHDPARPFLVMVGDKTVRVLGTTFSVRAEAGTFEVVVEEGLVQVEGPGTGEGEETVLLSPNQRIVVAKGTRRIDGLDDAEIARALSWRGGSLVFSETPLEEVVAEVSRYTTTRIDIAGEELRQTTIDGYFPVGEVDALLEALELGFGIEAHQTAPDRIELRRAG